jgi:hypothetical protein
VDVDEGSAAVITGDKHLALFFDPATIGLSDSDVKFRVLVPPKHGRVHVDGVLSAGARAPGSSKKNNGLKENDGGMNSLDGQELPDSFTLQELRASKVRGTFQCLLEESF